MATLNDLGPGAVISDFGNNWGVVVGAEIPNWRALETIAVETFIDGQCVGTGTAHIKPGPLGALASRSTSAPSKARCCDAGDVISTGMLTGRPTSTSASSRGMCLPVVARCWVQITKAAVTGG